MPNYKLVVGKIRSVRPMYPSEPGYVAQINAQLNDLKRSLNSIVQQFEDVTPQIMYDAVLPTKDLADIYCPKDTGALVESGDVEIISRGKQPWVEVGYAKGGNPFYAVYVHEVVGYRHEPPTRSKWLQAALFEDMGNIQGRLAASFGSFMGSGA